MTKEELIKRLEEIPGNPEVAILDSFNGAGYPRTINLGPYLFDTETCYTGKDFDPVDYYEDLNSPPGTPIIIMGYGFY